MDSERNQNLLCVQLEMHIFRKVNLLAFKRAQLFEGL